MYGPGLQARGNKTKPIQIKKNIGKKKNEKCTKKERKKEGKTWTNLFQLYTIPTS